MRILGADLATNRQRSSVKWRAYPDDVLPLWVAEMDAHLAPAVAAEVIACIERSDTGYPWPLPYIESFVEFAAATWSWRVDPRRVRVVTDVMVGMEELTRVLQPAGGRVIMDDPSYNGFALHAANLRREYAQVPLSPAGRLDLDRLEAAFSSARADGAPATYWLCNPQNPIGTVPTRDELSRLAELAAAYQVQVISDEIHAPLCDDDADFVPYLSVDPRGLAATSPSKAFNLAGLKAGLVVAGEEATPILAKVHPVVSYAASHLALRAHAVAYRDGRAWLDSLRREIVENRALLRGLLARRLPEVGWREPRSTYLAWLDVSGLELGETPAAVLAAEAKVALVEGTEYGPAGRGHVRMNLATSPAIITEAVERMARLVDDRRA